jgi:hypothetical protein
VDTVVVVFAYIERMLVALVKVLETVRLFFLGMVAQFE